MWGRGRRHFYTRRRTRAALNSMPPCSPFCKGLWDGEHSISSETLPVRWLGFSCFFNALVMPGASRCNQSLACPSPCQKELVWLCPPAWHHRDISQTDSKSGAEVCWEALQKVPQYPRQDLRTPQTRGCSCRVGPCLPAHGAMSSATVLQ